MPLAPSPRFRRVLAAHALVLLAAPMPAVAQRAAFTLDQVKSYPFPTELTAAATGSRIAWAFDERGARNLWVAEGPEFVARRLTDYAIDDGQELTGVSLSRDGRWVVYVRGGEHSGNWESTAPVNPTSNPAGQRMQLWAVPFEGGTPKAIGDGDAPAISPRGDRVAFERDGQIWIAPIDGSAAAKRLFIARGTNGSPEWSPDGARLAFVSGRGDHAFIGVYAGDTIPITWMAPSTSRDGSPRWSPDGTRIAFVRRPGAGGAPDSILVPRHTPWAIWSADAAMGAARQLWQAPTTHGGTNLHWAARGRIVFLSYEDGWPHLYSIPEAGGTPLLLTPGRYMAEHISLSADGTYLLFAGNMGGDAGDIDRRHVVRVPVDRAEPRALTPGAGLEWAPVVTGDGRFVAHVGATAQRPPLPAVVPADGGASRLLAQDRIPSEFPAAQLVTPRQVIFKSPDGVTVHAQLFERAGGPAKKPAVVYVHGGPPRQMLLGWHYSDYYANAYALNQYLASRGFVVLSVNYRLGIGYGYEFHRPARAGAQGAIEYVDVKAAGEWLRTQPQVDPRRIGVYGGSYGGFLTALALGRDSDLFAAGVDIHGVHDFTASTSGAGAAFAAAAQSARVEEAPDLRLARETAWRSSPVSSIATWRSPVLLIHGDDDRNVRFSQTVDLARRLAAQKVPYEELVIVDDTHHFMRHANQMRVNAAIAEFLERKLRARETAGRE